MGFTFGGSYPLTSSTTLSLAEETDPLLIECLRYLKACLLFHLQDRWALELARAAFTIEESDGYVCSSLVPYNLAAWGNQEHLVFPALSIARDSETYSERTTEKDAAMGVWTLHYMLPPMGAEVARMLMPVLKGAARVIHACLEQGYDSGVNGGAAWAADADLGLVSIHAVETRFETRAFEGSEGIYPSITMRIEVEEHLGPRAEDYEALTGIDGYVQSATDDEDPVDVAEYLIDDLDE